MYHYIYDAALAHPRHRLVLTAIENRLTDLGIHGKVDRLSLFKDVRETIHDGIRRGATTIVAVGTDETIKKVLEVMPEFSVSFGMIPVGKPNVLAKIFGIPEGVAACDVLSARLTQPLDIGRVNGQHFLSALSIPDGRVQLECDGAYRVTLARGGTVQVCNMTPVTEESARNEKTHLADPSDGLLETIISPRRSIWGGQEKNTQLNLRRIVVSAPEPFTYFLDGRRMKSTRVEIDVLPRRMKVIVGKERLFRVTPEAVPQLASLTAAAGI